MKREKPIELFTRPMIDVYPVATQPELDQLIRVHNHNMRVVEKRNDILLSKIAYIYHRLLESEAKIKKLENEITNKNFIDYFGTPRPELEKRIEALERELAKKQNKPKKLGDYKRKARSEIDAAFNVLGPDLEEMTLNMGDGEI